jgi:DNA polymerase-3 subunit epsilon
MIINWIKKNFADYPKFYQTYLETFNEKITFNEFIVFDIEIHISNDENKKIIRIFAYKVIKYEIILKEFIDLVIDNNININEKIKIVEAEAMIQFIDFIKNTPLISYQVNDKIELINQALKKIEAGKIENEIFDLEILYKSFQKIDENKLIQLQKMAEVLKITEYNQYNLNEKVLLESLIFLKLNKKINLQLFLNK